MNSVLRTIYVAILAAASFNMTAAQFVHRVAVEQDDVAIAPGTVFELPPAFCPLRRLPVFGSACRDHAFRMEQMMLESPKLLAVIEKHI